jgi:hypothetical protein
LQAHESYACKVRFDSLLGTSSQSLADGCDTTQCGSGQLGQWALAVSRARQVVDLLCPERGDLLLMTAEQVGKL